MRLAAKLQIRGEMSKFLWNNFKHDSSSSIFTAAENNVKLIKSLADAQLIGMKH